jgi:hypothetical protein
MTLVSCFVEILSCTREVVQTKVDDEEEEDKK